MRDLIMGLGNLPFQLVEPFLASLRDIAFHGDVCLFVYDVDLETLTTLRSSGVIVVNGRDYVRPGRALLTSRFLMYLEFLSRNQGRYDRVMLTDVRDVIFQSDPFAYLGDADIVYACERTLIRHCPINADWVRKAYGDAVYENIRDYHVSCAGTTIGTIAGILDYLTAMTDEMTVSSALEASVDQGIHNYIVHMRPLRGAFLDVRDRAVATLHYMPPGAVAVTARGVEVDGRLAPVVHQWDRREPVRDHVMSSERFRRRLPDAQAASLRRGPPEPAAPARVDGSEAIICHVGPERGTASVERFAKNIRETGYAGAIVVIGTDFVADDVAAARKHDCRLLKTDARYATLAPAATAHALFRDVLPNLNADDVFLIDGMGAIFVGNPFRAKTIGVSLCAEGAKLISDSRINTQRLALFGEPDARIAGRQIVSARLVCGRRAGVRDFYAALFREFEGKPQLLGTPGAMQGAINRIAWSERTDLPITVRPNGSLAFFGLWPTAMKIETERVVRIGGTAPAVIFARDRPEE